jgi:methylated-DNA-[protein]-cysteine S-methyltransferase
VIGADASLTGYGGGLHRKRWLLAHERGERPLFEELKQETAQ